MAVHPRPLIPRSEARTRVNSTASQPVSQRERAARGAHNWECGYLFEVTTRTLLCGDLFTQGGLRLPPLTSDDLLQPSEAFRKQSGYFEGGSSMRPGAVRAGHFAQRGAPPARPLTLLIHRLRGFDLPAVEHLRVLVRVESSGQVLFDDRTLPHAVRTIV